VKFFKRILRSVPSLLAAAAAMPFGGPAGAIAAAAAANAATQSKKNMGKNALQGAMIGATYVSAAPTIASKFGATSASQWGRAAGLNQRSLLSQMGMSSAPSAGGGMGFFGNNPNIGPMQPGKMEGLFNSAPGELSLLKALTGGDEKQGGQQGEQPEQGYPQFYAPQMMPGGQSPYIPGLQQVPMSRIESRPLSGRGSSLHSHPHRKGRARGYMTGGPVGHVGGGAVMQGDTDGQADDVFALVPEGSYVMNGMDVALQGNGSSDAGIKAFKEMEEHYLRSGLAKLSNKPRKMVPVWLSNREYVVRPEVVEGIGGDNLAKGTKRIDKGRINQRKHKGVDKILPPRAKNFTEYLKGTK
jgi:hypothetical protein